MASTPGTKGEVQDEQSLVTIAKQAALAPVRIAVSKPARRAYLTTLLLTLGAFALLGLAITGYTLFYWSYIPPVGFERQLHLQFDYVSQPAEPRAHPGSPSNANPHPYATVKLSPDIISQQRYDVKVELALPRTRENREAGNFMLEATMFAPGSVVIDALKEGISPGMAEEDNKLAVSRRPAMLKYRSAVVEALWKMTELHWYMLNFRDETEKLSILMFEGVEFPKGWRNVPGMMKLEVQSTHRLQIYSAKATFRARFRGLRWLMYNHRIISALAFIIGFWVTEMIFMTLAWAALSFYFSAPTPKKGPKEEEQAEAGVKMEDEADEGPALSATERTFPTSSRQPPLRYESPAIKDEDDDDAVVLPEAISRATEADDEDDDIGSFRDSGLGTGMESSSSLRDSARRRRSKFGPADDSK